MKNLYNRPVRLWWLVMVWIISAASSAQAQIEQPLGIQWQRLIRAKRAFPRYYYTPKIVKNIQGSYCVVTADRRLLFLTATGSTLSDTPIDGVTNVPSVEISGFTPTQDGGVVIGVRDSLNVWSLQKRDGRGAIVWLYRFPDNSSEPYTNLANVVASPDGGFIALRSVGYPLFRNGPFYHVKVQKFDKDGNGTWSQYITHPNVNETHVKKGINAIGGGYLLVGFTSNGTRDGGSGWIAKVDEEGNLIWQKGNYQAQMMQSAALYDVMDGTYIVSGSVYSSESRSDFAISSFIIDSQGKLVQSGKPVNIAVDYELSSVVATPPMSRPSRYVVAVQNTAKEFGPEDIQLTGFSDPSIVVWSKTLGGSQRDYFDGSPSIEATDDGFILAGITLSNDGDLAGIPYQGEATWIVKFGPPVITGTIAQAEPVDVKLLGNPADEQVGVRVRGAQGKTVQLRLTDLQGRLLESRTIERAGLVEEQYFSLDGATPGLLLLQATVQHQTYLLKVIRHP